MIVVMTKAILPLDGLLLRLLYFISKELCKGKYFSKLLNNYVNLLIYWPLVDFSKSRIDGKNLCIDICNSKFA